jgi:thiol-disulfide isomerase/thioredoxin
MKILLLLMSLMAGLAHAEVRPFLPGSLAQIQAARVGKPFILALWSASCTHCPGELKALGDLARQYAGLEVVLVATDTPELAPQLARLAESYGLGDQAQWVFADAQSEKLRFEIDRRWYGELPRTYFFDARHRREGRSGLIPGERLERWASEHVK